MTATTYLILFQIILILWSASGLVAKMMSLSSESLTFYRMLISTVIFIAISKTQKHIPTRNTLASRNLALLSGLFLTLHWWAFFESIKVSTVSIGVICLSACPFFTTLIEPIYKRKTMSLYNIILSSLAVSGISIIFHFESHYKSGIALGLFGSLTLAINTIITEELSKKISPTLIIKYQMLSGSILGFLWFFITDSFETLIIKNYFDLGGVFFLSLFCTSFTMWFNVKCLKVLGSFSIVLSANMESIYGIILALVFLGQSEYMHTGFYWGSLILILTVFIDWYFRHSIHKNSQHPQT
ncbi:MAG: hypothetical protein CMP11_04020 [Zetaproteobacteria bacterium]|nr:hypothetical protein [Pseudobdellovibrionaceae bacterium]|tara:strand:+ start:532 stop:1425 length:894 start_codon:yes stop_codon:yes gene_type:complete